MPRFAQAAPLCAALALIAVLAPNRPFAAAPAPAPGRRLILVTEDGVRWQEVFRGAEERIAADKRRTRKAEEIARRFVAPADRVAALTPFLQSIPRRGGVLLGDRDANTCFRVGNKYWFSYPGYNEILTGRADSWANTNSPVPNPDITFLEWLDHSPGFEGKVRVVASDFFKPILNTARSRFSTNGIEGQPLAGLPKGGDARIQALALRTLKEAGDTRVLYVAFGDTDHYAHGGEYDEYLLAIHDFDDYLRQLWEAAQADPAWAGKTTLIVTTDHGRGKSDLDNENWRHHGSGYVDENWRRLADSATPAPEFQSQELEQGSDQTWAAFLGPAPAKAAPTPPPGLCPTASQVAATAIQALGLDWRAFNPKIGVPFAAPSASE